MHRLVDVLVELVERPQLQALHVGVEHAVGVGLRGEECVVELAARVERDVGLGHLGERDIEGPLRRLHRLLERALEPLGDVVVADGVDEERDGGLGGLVGVRLVHEAELSAVEPEGCRGEILHQLTDVGRFAEELLGDACRDRDHFKSFL